MCVWHTTGVCNTPQCALHTSEGVSDGTEKAHLILVCYTQFRFYSVEKAFLMIKVKEADQEVLRFLWYADVTKVKPELKAYKFTRVVIGVSPSPYLSKPILAEYNYR